MNKAVSKKLENFFTQFESIYYARGGIIIRPQDSLFRIYFVKQGFVRQYVISSSGEELTLHTYKPNSFFPLAMILSNSPNKYYFEASTPSQLISAPADKVIEYIKREKDLLFDLTTRFAEGLSGYLMRLEHLLLEKAYSQVVSLLIYLAKKFGKEDARGVTIQLPLTHRQIANWIGVSRETVSREIEKLQKKDLITSSSRQIIVRNIISLEKETKAPQEDMA